MSKVCEICGKGPATGKTIARRGLAKAKGGVGLKITGVNKRRFMPNLQVAKIIDKGTVRRIKICTGCLRAGKVKKA